MTTVQRGLTYYHVTTAVDSQGRESIYSNEAADTAPSLPRDAPKQKAKDKVDTLPFAFFSQLAKTEARFALQEPNQDNPTCVVRFRVRKMAPKHENPARTR